ncbi:MAG: hypothetical protein ACP5JN_03345 [Candidatus Micrarchaeia archaeon]
MTDAFKEVESKYMIQIQELSFGDDFSHVHMEVSIPNKLSIAQVIQDRRSATELPRPAYNIPQKYK